MIRQNQRFLTIMYIIFDLLCIASSFGIAWWFKFQSGLLGGDSALPYSSYLLWSGVYALIFLSIGFLASLYVIHRKKRFADQLVRIIQTQVISLFVLFGLLFFVKQVHISREYLAIFVTVATVLMIIYRYAVKITLRTIRQKGYNKQFILIVGAGSLGKRFYSNLSYSPELGYEVVGFLDDRAVWDEDEQKAFRPILGTINELEDILNEQLIDEVIIALPLDVHHKFPTLINTCEKSGVRTLIIPDFFDYLPARPYFDNFAGMPLINVRDIPLDMMSNRIFKRCFDILFAVAAIVLTLPVMAVIALGIKLTSRGPIIFKQERVGLNRRNFNMYKFRSMRVDTVHTADTQWTTENDPRKTKFGSFLRKSSLDELPQFFNVLFGHMSVVGPRPERPYFVEQFKEEIPKYMVKHHVRPGITGWAQSNGLRGDTSIEERIRHDIFYIENWSLLFDIKIIWKTIWNGFINKNAY
ncbi:undecaprenyl-phosphate glucose phosphotransferase [Paenibacillus assamensis]|uniref:undecaprenyl-phosphate glucose phosphotransferase n=1 Tax=Paenibacillus assamensis TaxID=311244 RepID=UPI00042359CF|nr:undecaprenyl-phosphate glucose phosphotransferase [Paenibacillus assamensis]